MNQRLWLPGDPPADEAQGRRRQDNAHSLTGQVFDRAKGENEYADLIQTQP